MSPRNVGIKRGVSQNLPGGPNRDGRGLVDENDIPSGMTYGELPPGIPNNRITYHKRGKVKIDTGEPLLRIAEKK